VQRWIDGWNAYWFPSTSTLALSICRIVVVAVHVVWFIPAFASLPEQIYLLEKNSDFVNPQLIISAISAAVPRAAFFTPDVFTVLHGATLIAGILALVGLFTRVSLLLLTLGTWILIAHKYSYGDQHHPEALLAIFLLLLACAPSGQRLSLDALIRRRVLSNGATGLPNRLETAMWPLRLTHVLLALTYFSTGMSKLIEGGLEWMNGYTLQSYTFQDAVNRKLELGLWLAQHHELAIALSIFTILFETFFFVSLLVPRIAPLFFVTGVFFHLGLFATGGHPFFPHIVLLLLLLFFLDPQWWRSRVNKYLGAYHPSWRRQVGLQRY
jgi:uncharacterized membrane protein YphA (DoxX/SURF4 family)